MYIYSRYAGSSKNFGTDIINGKLVIYKDKTSEGDWDFGNKKIYTIVNKQLERKVCYDTTTGEMRDLWYGHHYIIRKNGKIVLKEPYRRDYLMSVHGHCTYKDVSFGGSKGTRQSWAYRGGLKAEKFIYDNGVVAYDFKRSKRNLRVFRPNKDLWIEYFGVMDTAWKIRDGLFSRTNNDDAIMASSFIGFNGNIRVVEYDTNNKVKNSITAERNQMVGEAIIDGRKAYYMSGVEVTKEIFNQKPEDMDSNAVLIEKNAQLRAAFFRKMGTELFFKKLQGKYKVVHETDTMKLFSIPFSAEANSAVGWRREDTEYRFLQVTCPSTGNIYTLRVPPAMNNCEQARQWTFRTGNRWSNDITEGQYIKFALET